jgi:hypothetical protein
MSTETTISTTSSQLSTSINGSQYYSVPYMGQQYLSQDYNNPTEAFENFVLNEAGKLYEKLLEDSIDKTISNVPNDISPNVNSSSLLHQTGPFDIKNSSSVKKIATYAYRKEEEEHMFVQSETKNEDMTQDDQLGL